MENPWQNDVIWNENESDNHHEPISILKSEETSFARHVIDMFWLTEMGEAPLTSLKLPPYAILTATSFVENAKKDPSALPCAL